MNQEFLNTISGKTVLLLGITAFFAQSCRHTNEKPNILWITLEDTSPHFMGYCGNEHVKTPNIDKLAKEGVIFNNAFASGPVCSASRSTLITGVNNLQLGSGNHRSQFPLPEYIRGFPSYMRKTGYFTSNNAKTDYSTSNEKEVIEASWDESNGNAGWWNRGDAMNFFTVVNFLDCHQSRTMTNPWDWYEMQVLQNLEAKDLTHPDEIDVPPIYRDTPEMRKNLSRVYNSINLVDKQVGLLVDSLKRHGLMESTIIFFFADHGEGIPRGKSSSIGLSYRVPFFIWFPDKFKHLSPWKKGRPTDELICFEDLPPTMLSLAGVEIPAYMTGRAIMGNQRKEPFPYVFGSRNRIDDSPDLVRTATDGQFFYTREFFPRYPSVLYQKYADVSDILRSIRKDYSEGLLNAEQSLMLDRRETEYLYDLKNDPWELTNLAGNPQYAEKLDELRKACYERALWNKDLHFLPEYNLAKISKETSPYEYGKDEGSSMKEIIDAAYEVTDPNTLPERLYAYLESGNEVIRYWAAVGIHNNVKGAHLSAESLKQAMRDPYGPVAIESAAILWENFEEPEAEKILISYAVGTDSRLALQALQMMVYMEKVSNAMIASVETMLDKRNSGVDGYPYVYELRACADMLLYMQKGKPLYLPDFEKWTDPKYLQEKMN
jgi:arylsulfatase A-like enzyme